MSFLHQIWLNDLKREGKVFGTLPSHVYPWVMSWRTVALQKGWEVRYWDNADMFKLTTKAERDKCGKLWQPKIEERGIDGVLIGVGHPIHVMALKALADLMRYRILSALGGLYVDLDIELLDPSLLDELSEERIAIVHPAHPDTNCNCLLWSPSAAEIRSQYGLICDLACETLAATDKPKKPTHVTGPRMIGRRFIPNVLCPYDKIAHPTIAYSQWPAARPIIPGETKAIIHNRWRAKGFAAGAPGDVYDPSATERNTPMHLRTPMPSVIPGGAK